MISLVPMTCEEYEIWLDQSIRSYAAEKIEAGSWTAEEALERSRADFARLLPQGMDTPGNLVFKIQDQEAGADVGALWLNTGASGDTGKAFVYELAIHEPYRRQGYGTQGMLAAEERARDAGCSSIWLHVFGHNQAARHLYRKVGYRETDVMMTKELGGNG